MRRGLANAQAYRGGMVLGLTLAEIMVLLVFMMLLAAASLLLRQDDAAARADDQARGITVAIAKAEAAQAQVTGLEAVLNQTRQSAAQAEANGSRQQAQAVAALAGLTAELAVVRGEAQALLGQNAQMRSEIQRIHGNAGSGLPYCWAMPDGKPLTLLRVTLRDDGVIAQDPAPRSRPDDPLWARLIPLQRGMTMPMESFLTQVGAVITHSNSDRCRHAIEVIDATGPTNKRGYKGLMNQLWGNFLLREVGG